MKLAKGIGGSRSIESATGWERHSDSGTASKCAMSDESASARNRRVGLYVVARVGCEAC